MERHVSLVGVLFIVYHILGLFAGLLVFVVLSGIGLFSGDLQAIGILVLIGTALGVYTFWTLMHVDSEALFRVTPSH
jgi:hypothetical protein